VLDRLSLEGHELVFDIGCGTSTPGPRATGMSAVSTLVRERSAWSGSARRAISGSSSRHDRIMRARLTLAQLLEQTCRIDETFARWNQIDGWLHGSKHFGARCTLACSGRATYKTPRPRVDELAFTYAA